jgi:hypothetical protein
LKADLRHYPFENLADQIQTNNRYSSLGALALHENGKRFSSWQLLTKPTVKFIELYLFKGGIWDGWAGYIIAIGGAYSIFLKYAKLWELQKTAKQKA